MARPNGQRRLAAILAMDVVGYSALVERDESGTLARLRTLRVEVITPILTSRGGRVAKLMGDGAIVEFASAAEAVLAAIEMQSAVAAHEAELSLGERIVLRVGINLGDVVVEPDGDVLGDGVNIAARLEQLAEPGGICLSEAVVRGIRSGLPVAAKDLGPQRLKNIAEPVRAYRLLVDRPAVQPKPSPPLRRVLVAAVSALVLLAAIGGAGWWWRAGSRSDSAAQTTAGQRALPLPDRPSIAVLPFDNLSGDERIGRLADGMVEDIITDLSRFRELFVIARNSTFVYKGKAVDMREVGRELGVRYVLDGSVQSTDDRLRLTAQLIDTSSGAQVWSERYDRPLDDLFAVQSDVAERIVGSIGGTKGAYRKSALEAVRRRPTQSLEAYDLVLLGTEARLRLTKEDNAKAVELLRRAVSLDPSLPSARVALAMAYWNQVDFSWAPFQQAMAAWLAEAQQAVALDPSDAMAHVVLGLRWLYANDWDVAAAEFEAALRANPNDPYALALIAGNSTFLEPPARLVGMIERAARLNPFDIGISHMAKLVYFFAGDFKKAIANCKAHGAPSFFDFLYLAMSYGELGMMDEASANAAMVLKAKPEFSAEWILTYQGEFAPAAAANRALLFDGIDKAGLPQLRNRATDRGRSGDPTLAGMRRAARRERADQGLKRASLTSGSKPDPATRDQGTSPPLSARFP